MNKVYYVECKHIALVRCRYEDKQFGKGQVEFYPFVLDKYTGQPRHTGFTTISEQQLNLLKEHSKVFNKFVANKLLIITDTLPASARTPQELISMKELEIQDLKAKLAASEAGKTDSVKFEQALAAKDEEIARLKASIKELKAPKKPAKAVKESVKDDAPAQF